MKNYTNILALFWASFAFSQLAKKEENETIEQFATRQKPANSEISHKIIETKWNGRPIVVAFYDQLYKLPKDKDPDQQNYHRIIGKFYERIAGNEFRAINIDEFDSEGGNPVIESLFFANADNDEAKEMIVVVSWEQRHYDVEGVLYGTFIYDNIVNEIPQRLDFM